MVRVCRAVRSLHSGPKRSVAWRLKGGGDPSGAESTRGPVLGLAVRGAASTCRRITKSGTGSAGAAGAAGCGQKAAQPSLKSTPAAPRGAAAAARGQARQS